MGLSLLARQSLRLKQEQRIQNLLKFGDGHTATVFPLTEKEMKKVSVQRMLTETYEIDDCEVGYRSMMDMLLCETMSQFQSGCVDFYAGKGPQFKSSYSEDYCRLIDRNLLAYLGVAKLLAHKRHWNGEEVPQWRDFVQALIEKAKGGADLEG